MARYSEQDRSGIDRLVDRWREKSLLGDASFLHPEDVPEAWSYENVDDLYQRFVGNPIEGSESFATKWQDQLEGASAEVRLLAAECLTIYYLFTSTVGYQLKVEMVNRTIGTEAWLISEADTDLHQAFDSWIANPGMRYNTMQYRQMAYLIDFCWRMKSLDPSERRELLYDNPWGFMNFADDTDEHPDAMRHVVCHLLYPEYFERISSQNHKEQIYSAFSTLYDAAENEELDQRLYGIRSVLEEKIPGGEESRDFYSEELDQIWRTAASDATEISPLSALRRKKQIVFHGPPGTGKTYTATKLAEALIRSSAIQQWGVETYFTQRHLINELVDSHVIRLQLHPGIGYSEFIAGLQLGEDGRTEFREGILLELVRKMQEETSDSPAQLPHVLILDEINRTDLSAMLGEAFSAIEADKRGIPVTLPATDTAGDNRTLIVPDDLYIIGTMNEIDHSVESLDFALRRRFLWFDASFDPDGLRSIWQHEWERVQPRISYEEADEQLEHLIENIQLLNDEIADTPDLGSAYEIGHAFFHELAFLVDETFQGRRPVKGTILWTPSGKPRTALTSLWNFSIRPLLEQYLAGSDEQQSLLTTFRETLLAPPGDGHAR